MIACDEHWWGVQNKTGCGGSDYFEADLTVGHRLLPLQAGALPSPQPPTPGALGAFREPRCGQNCGSNGCDHDIPVDKPVSRWLSTSEACGTGHTKITVRAYGCE